MNLDKYKKEIELMKKQNMTEYDMYSIIASIIREGKNVELLSIRDVYFILNLCAKFSLKSQPSIYGKYGKWIL